MVARAFLCKSSITHIKHGPVGSGPFPDGRNNQLPVSYFEGWPELFILETLVDKTQRSPNVATAVAGGSRLFSPRKEAALRRQPPPHWGSQGPQLSQPGD